MRDRRRGRPLRIVIVVTRTRLVTLAVLALGLGLAGLLSSENITLTTTYPSPSGVYGRLVSTAQTLLARDTGNVGIGTANPAAKLDVSGGAGVSGDLAVGGSVAAGDVRVGSQRVVVTMICGAGLSCVKSGNSYTIDLAPSSPPPPPPPPLPPPPPPPPACRPFNGALQCCGDQLCYSLTGRCFPSPYCK